MKTARVKFFDATRSRGSYYHKSSSERTYDYAYDGAVESGDIALVHNGSEFCLVKVIEVLAGTTSKVTKHLLYVANKAEMEEYEKANKAIQRKKEILLQLEQIAEEETLEQRFKALSQRNKTAKSLVDELKSLG